MLVTKLINTQTGEIKEKKIAPPECLIGRHPTCDLVIDSPEVSRVHARTLLRKGKYYFADLGSTDGSRINNEEVRTNLLYSLQAKDAIRIGDFMLLIEAIETEELNGLVDAEPSGNGQGTPGKIVVRCVAVIEETADVKTFVFVSQCGLGVSPSGATGESSAVSGCGLGVSPSGAPGETRRANPKGEPFRVAEPPKQFAYRPGQFVTLHLEIDGQRVSRCYSISSAPSRPHTLDITVKRIPGGLVSNWLHDNIKLGSKVNLSGPMGEFTCAAKPSRQLLLVSAGSGITPMMSMSRWLCDTAADVDIVFLHSARSPQDIIFRQELELMAARYPNFKLAVTVTSSESGAWLGYRGRLNESMLQAIAPDFRDRSVYVCGPNPFMEAVKAMLEGLDFPMQNYYEESFGSPPTPKKMPKPPEPVDNGGSPAPASSASSLVVFEQSNKKVSCDGEDSILELAELEGVAIPRGCGTGVCGACKTKLVEGDVRYAGNPQGLGESDRSAGFVLTCIAHPVGKVVVDA